MRNPFETGPANNVLYGDIAIKNELHLIQSERFSRRELDRYIQHLDSVYGDREPAAVAVLAQKLLREALRLDEIREDAVERILSIIQKRGLYVEPLETVGGKVEGVEPASSYEEFLERNRINESIYV
jgi:hypothetical protein